VGNTGHRPSARTALRPETVNVLEQQRAALLAVERSDLAVDLLPIQRPRELNQLGSHVDDLIQPRAEQIAGLRRAVFLGRIIPSDATRESCFTRQGIPKTKCKVPAPPARNLPISNCHVR
jgi:hypothetical protein